MLKRKPHLLILLALTLTASACQNRGGTEAGNPAPTTRSLTGTVPNDGGSPPACEADTVVATEDTGASTLSAAVSPADCTFSIELETEKSYAVSFETEGEFVAALVIDPGDGNLPSSFIRLSEGGSPVGLGILSFLGGVATPETSPLTQTDQDGDGTPDSEDSDNNGEQITDLIDCDLDGVLDIFDTDTESCAPPEEGEDPVLEALQILEVYPPNNAGISGILSAIALNAPVRARAGCEIDPASVNGTTFRVRNVLGIDVNCAYSLSGDGKTVTCSHGSDLFSLLTVYTAQLDGVSCLGGTDGSAVTWTWRTVGLF